MGQRKDRLRKGDFDLPKPRLGRKRSARIDLLEVGDSLITDRPAIRSSVSQYSKKTSKIFAVRVMTEEEIEAAGKLPRAKYPPKGKRPKKWVKVIRTH